MRLSEIETFHLDTFRLKRTIAAMTRKRPEEKSTPRKMITRGGRKLAELMAELNIGPSEVARATGLDRVGIYRVIRGDHYKHVSVDFALAIRSFSKGRITVEDFSSMTATPASEADEPPVTGTYG